MWRFLRSDAIAVLSDKMAQKSLGRYFAVMRDERLAKFKIAKKLPAEFSEKDTTEELWRKHQNLIEEFYRLEREIDAGKRKLQEENTEKSKGL